MVPKESTPLQFSLVFGSWLYLSACPVAVLCNTDLWYDRIAGSETNLVVLFSALLSTLYFRKHLSKTLNNYTFYLFYSEIQSMEETPPFINPFSRLVTIPLENFKYPLDVQTSTFLLLRLLNAFQVLFKDKQLIKNTTQRSALRLDSFEWQRMWNSMGNYLGQWAPPVLELYPWTSTESGKSSKIFGKNMQSPWQFERDTNHHNMLWPGPYLFNTIQYPQEERKPSGYDNKMRGTVATPTPATDSASHWEGTSHSLSCTSL